MFQLDHVGLRRLGFFLLAHVVIDTRLIALALFKAVSQREGMSLTEIQALADDLAERGFLVHLDKVRDELPPGCAEIAEQVNKARNDLLHWKHDRHALPVYEEQEVVSDEGFRRCMDDVMRFIQTVPFKTPGP
jgi:hypothetical protein